MSEVTQNPDEKQRLEALQSYGVIESSEREDLTGIVFLAALICETPIAAVNFITEDKQIYKSKLGFAETSGAREGSLCNLTLQNKKPFIVKEISQDEKLKMVSLPNVSSKIEFYAGFPLVSPQGFVLGTLFVMDIKSRELSKIQMDSLAGLSRQVIHSLELLKKIQTLKLTVREAIHEVNNHAAIINGSAYFLKESTTKEKIEAKLVLNNSERIQTANQKVVQKLKDLRAILLS